MEARPARALVAWCPDFPVTALGADLDEQVAVLSGEGARRRVVACSPAARAAGVRRGQRLRDAQRLAPELRAFARDEAAEARAFEPVVVAAEQVAAGMEVIRPGLLALSARGPARYYGGERALGVVLRDRIAQVETGAGGAIVAGIGIADGVTAAGIAARTPGADEPVIIEPGGSAAYLAPFPLSVLGAPVELVTILDQLGVRSVGRFAALPAGDVAGRFGAEGVLLHRLARGLDLRPPASRRPAEDLAVEHEFDPPAETDQPVVFVAKMLAARLHAGLSAAGLACVRVGIEAETVSGRVSYRLWRHADATGGRLSSAGLAQRAAWQLDGWRTREAYPVPDPVALLRLVPDQLVLDTGIQQVLWGAEEVPDRVARAAERVQALLGHESVARLRIVGGRSPAEMIARVPWGEEPDAEHDSAPWPGAVLRPAPSTVPVEPIPADLLDARQVPVEVSGRARLSAPPAWVVLEGREIGVSGYAGPWGYERSWDPAGRLRRARMQCRLADGRVLLLVLEASAWRVEAIHQ
ncbi:DNA polymerase Y family protein [Actinospica sp. MGRD01-02]|uniref:DNA polymerase Y family protein n=1 Tax=Actinospica acidithermotolerans TaxID=2828514 RepID=A0A941EII8_9ACTN|nr:DNA polymerase Y family protein [Actinospica acidithermotolerans]MBR7831370.1 DNA polymerase Y family protein [Actinospica acidithermotolerans]